MDSTLTDRYDLGQAVSRDYRFDGLCYTPRFDPSRARGANHVYLAGVSTIILYVVKDIYVQFALETDLSDLGKRSEAYR